MGVGGLCKNVVIRRVSKSAVIGRVSKRDWWGMWRKCIVFGMCW